MLEIIPEEQNKVKRMKSIEDSLRDLWDNIKCTNIRTVGSQKKKQRRRWHPTPVLLPGKSHGWRSLMGCSPRGREESDRTLPTLLSLFTFMHWRRKWQPTPVFLPGESQGWWSLVGCRIWGHTDSDTTEVT